MEHHKRNVNTFSTFNLNFDPVGSVEQTRAIANQLLFSRLLLPFDSGSLCGWLGPPPRHASNGYMPLYGRTSWAAGNSQDHVSRLLTCPPGTRPAWVWSERL